MLRFRFRDDKIEYVYFLREWVTFRSRLTVFVLFSNWVNHFRHVISFTIFVFLVLFWIINLQIRHPHTWIFVFIFVINCSVCKFSDRPYRIYKCMNMERPCARCCCARSKRHQDLGRGQDKASTAWLVHGCTFRSRIFKIKSIQLQRLLWPLLWILQKYLRAGLAVFKWFLLFPPDKLQKRY